MDIENEKSDETDAEDHCSQERGGGRGCCEWEVIWAGMSIYSIVDILEIGKISVAHYAPIIKGDTNERDS